MHVEFDIPNITGNGRVFFTWVPVEIEIRLADNLSGNPQQIELRNGGTGGQLVFDTIRSNSGSDTLSLDLPGDGSPLKFWAAGKFGVDANGDPLVNQGSNRYGDAIIEAVESGTNNLLGSQACMVRVRKNANAITTDERNAFLEAFGTLNGSGTGRFTNFRDMHSTFITGREGHGNSGFLPWHRAYLLDLEREMQDIDDQVTLPYWKFDAAAPNLFSRSFIGLNDMFGSVEFVTGHPFTSWTTDGTVGIRRFMNFQPDNAPPNIRSEEDTLALEDGAGNKNYAGFLIMEGNPHGRAHTRFALDISDPRTAPKDPLFFLLHCNVDRLWAKWQWLNQAMDKATAKAFAAANPDRVGHRLDDTMWPWNGATGNPRPPDAPGGPLAASPLTGTPGNSPEVGDMLDFQNVAGNEQHYFCYDNVPFELDATAIG